MKVKIDVKGYLWLQRKSVLVKVFCPYGSADKCGDWCPLFGEPEDAVFNYIDLAICNNKVFHIAKKDFEDERK